MPSTMTNDPGVAQKSLRIRLPSSIEGVAPSTPRPIPSPSRMRPKSILRSRQGESPATTMDPLQSETYFQGPLRTLIASIENEGSGTITTHDITEAYILLSCRIEVQADNLGDDASPAVMAVRNLPSHPICAAIRRDVSSAISGVQGPDDQSSLARMTDDERSRAKDRSSLCHASLRFLSDLFRFPPLHRLLKLHELAWTLKELLDVGLSSDLVTLSPQKTYTHVIGVLYNQRLPDSVLRPLRSKIAVVLERAASGIMEGSATSGPHIDGLKAIHALLHRHGSLLFPEFQKVFKVVLQNLVCPVPTFRDLAAKVLTAFAHATLKSGITAEDQLKFSSIVDAFIDKEVQRAKDAHKRDSNTFVLRDFLKLSEDDPRIVQRVAQVLNIISALLVLSGPCIFTRPNSLKFLIKAVGKTQPFRERELNVLRAATWSCLVRAYGLLLSWDISKSEGLEESAFRVVRQEYREDVGISVIAVLLGPLEHDVRPIGRVREAITYLYHLGQMPETRGVTAALMRRLLGGILNDADSDTCTWSDPASVIPSWLSNGSTLEMEPRKLRKFLATLSSADMHTVRILEADELVLTWESLVEAFQGFAIGQLFDRKAEISLQNDTLLLWQALLKVQSALVPAFSRDVVLKPVLECLATTLNTFLDAPCARFPIRSAQALTATYQLWKLVNDELGELWAAALAGSIYRRLLKAWQHEIANNTMTDEWVQLSRLLISSAPKRSLEILRELDDTDVQRVIWLDMVRHVRYKERPAKEVILHLLLFPIQTTEHTLEDEEHFSYWDMLFMLAFTHHEPEVVCAMVAEELQRTLSFKPCGDLRKFFMSSVYHASRSDSPPSLFLLSVTGGYLEEAYPPDDCEDNELMDLIPALQRIIQEHPSLAIMKTLKLGLMPWFKDRKSHIPDIIYNNDILPLYCDLFSAIRRLSPIEEALIELSDLITAPFSRSRIPEPATGPIAFKEFWDSVGPTLDFMPQAFPPALTNCVISLHNAFGGYIPEWMESQLESQATHSSEADLIVPASVEDLESSDMSPISIKRRTRTESHLSTPKLLRGGKAFVIQAPEVSPSIGEPSPQFALYRRNETVLTPPISLELKRASKKRKVLQSGAMDHPSNALGWDHGQSSPVNNQEFQQQLEPVFDDETLLSRQQEQKQKRTQVTHQLSSPEPGASSSRQDTLKGSHALEEDYSSWEIRVASQDVREVPQDDLEEMPRIGDSPSLRTQGAMRDLPRLNAEHRIDRSQTAPASLQAASEGRCGVDEALLRNQDRVDAKLRRTHTSTKVPLDALEKLHAKLSAEADDMQTQDLAQATKLTYDVLGILNGRISEKLENRK